MVSIYSPFDNEDKKKKKTCSLTWKKLSLIKLQRNSAMEKNEGNRKKVNNQNNSFEAKYYDRFIVHSCLTCERQTFVRIQSFLNEK